MYIYIYIIATGLLTSLNCLYFPLNVLKHAHDIHGQDILLWLTTAQKSFKVTLETNTDQFVFNT